MKMQKENTILFTKQQEGRVEKVRLIKAKHKFLSHDITILNNVSII